jgi:thymidine phosphorylase
MGALASVDLRGEDLHRVVKQAGGCIAWGGALDLAPADDVLITVERPMQLDTEAQMVASILAKKKTAGATHALIDIPLGPATKVRTQQSAEELGRLFRHVANIIGLDVDVVTTDARGPIGCGIGPRLEALDVLAVLRRDADAPIDLREKSLFLAGRILERTGVAPDSCGYRTAQEALDSGRAEQAFQRIVEAQGPRALPEEARFKALVVAPEAGRISQIDCLGVGRIAKLAGSPAHPAAGLRCLARVGDVVEANGPLFEIHAQSDPQLRIAEAYARRELHRLVRFGY